MNAIVFGATSGIGRAVALNLGEKGAQVALVGRDQERGEGVASKIGGTFYRCDATLISEVRRVVGQVVKSVSGNKIDVCVFSQGIATMQGRTETSEGIDVKMALHYYGRVAAALELQKLDAFGPHPKMIFVLSGSMHKPYVGGLSRARDWELKNNYSIANAANACGFYTDVAVHQLANAISGLRAVHAYPGFVRTSWGTELPWLVRMFVRTTQLFATPAETSAAMLVDVLMRAAPGPVIASASGKELKSKPEMTMAVSDQIWEHTKEVLNRR